MIKMLFLCKKRPDLGREEYARRILEGHVPLAIRHHPTLRHYVVNVVETGPDYDSIAELSFDTLADFRERLYDSPEGQEIIQRDVDGFLASADAYATRERIHLDRTGDHPLGERTPGVKWICALQRRRGMSREEFERIWLEDHVQRALKVRRNILRYATLGVEEKLSESGDDWDGFTVIHFADERDARSALDERSESMQELGPSRQRFLGRGLLYTVSEYVQK